MHWNEFRMPKCQWPFAKETLIELGLYILWTVCKSMWVQPLFECYPTRLLHTYGILFEDSFLFGVKVDTPDIFRGYLTGRQLEPGYFEDYPTTRFLKQKILKFCGKRNIHKCEGFFLRGRVSSNGFKVFNSCIVLLEFLYAVRFAQILENLLFSKNAVIG